MALGLDPLNVSTINTIGIPIHNTIGIRFVVMDTVSTTITTMLRRRDSL